MWRPIEGFSNYKVNREGEVWRFINGRKHKMALHKAQGKRGNKNPYYFYKLTNDEGKTLRIGAAKLIATAFWGKAPTENHIAIHKNGITGDISAYNLMWVDRYKSGKVTGKMSSKKIVKIDKDGNDVCYYNSMKEAAEKNFLSRQCLSMHCKGTRYGTGKLKTLICPDGYYYAYNDDREESRKRVYKDIERRKTNEV